MKSHHTSKWKDNLNTFISVIQLFKNKRYSLEKALMLDINNSLWEKLIFNKFILQCNSQVFLRLGFSNW